MPFHNYLTVSQQLPLFHLVQGEGEVRVELLQAGGDVPTLLASVDARHEEVDEPREAVLVHGLDVGQVGNAEEQDLAGVRDGGVASTDLPSRSSGRFCTTRKAFRRCSCRLYNGAILP